MKKLLFPVITLTLILLMASVVSASADTIWEIGDPDGDRDEFQPDSLSEILYTVGTSATEHFPSMLDRTGISAPSYVDIVFTTNIPYAPAILLYDRMGGETDEVWLDGDLLDTCTGPTDPNPSMQYLFNIDNILPGTHTLTIKCVSGGDGRHWIDWLQLSGNPVEPTVTTGRSGPSTVDIGNFGDVDEWTITIEICPDDVVNLDDVVVQGGIGADLAIIAVDGTPVDYPMAKKTEDTVGDVTLIKKGGKMGATIVRWGIGTLVSNGCLTLELTVQTGKNPKEKQEFTSTGLHDLDGGFSATYWYGEMKYETLKTDPLTVDVE